MNGEKNSTEAPQTEPEDIWAPVTLSPARHDLTWALEGHLDPNCVVEVDTGTDVPERWTGASWNGYIRRTQIDGEEPTNRVLELHNGFGIIRHGDWIGEIGDDHHEEEIETEPEI